MKDFPAQYDLQDEDVLYFPHIPKTAGMTFRTILEDQFHNDDVCPATLNAQLKDYSQADYEKYRLFRGHINYVDIPQILSHKHLLLVTVLREPVARVISHYEYIRRMPGDPHYDMVKDMTLEEFAQGMPVGRLGKNVQTYYIAKLAQFDLNHLSPDEVFDLAKKQLDRLAFVGILERFQDSLFLLSYIFGWKPIINTRRENAAKDKKSKEEIPPSTIELIKQNSLLDIDLYQYAKELFETRFAEMQRDLLTKYGAFTHPQTVKEPMSSQVTQELLERHAEQRFLNLNPDISNSLSYDFVEPLRGTGWHRRESLNDRSGYRWIGPETSATLDFPVASDEDVIIEIKTICNYATTPDVAASLTLDVNGHPVQLEILYSDRGSSVRWFRAIVPKVALDNGRVFSRLTFRVNRVVSFTEVNPLNPDPRVVGIAVNSLKIFPVHAAKTESAALSVFELKSWRDVATFLEKHLGPGDKIAAPLVFQLKLPNEVLDYQTAFLSKVDFQWLILYKGTIENLNPILFNLLIHRFSPVFADGNFVVFTRQKQLPKLSFLALHVRALYEDRIKVPIKLYIIRQLKQIKSLFVRRSKQAETD
ncbi:sulfotransferase family 2 domain-containing protein [Oscillatoria sp. FACHB-1407]|uniref:sulfotransferase family 2 domain-containing protein n=1 Tax=Oscillatoria sp. FACHB-1407 TaxID=2692847 RepID=UPI0016891E4C|nr:sulfotransferase family 2 domain-containing protein [Oscillatoria sp. FACHB-1407]MBD2462786.1 sulfotransferase family 2 domain-containing protein [Oscillatoria sp. FACHB-1407]